MVVGLISGGDIDAGDLPGQGFKGGGTVGVAGVGEQGAKICGQGVAFAEKKGIEEQGQGFRVEHGGDAAGDDGREILTTLSSQERQVRQLQDSQDAQIIGLEGQGEGHGGKIGEGALGFQGEQGRLGAAVFLEQARMLMMSIMRVRQSIFLVTLLAFPWI